MMLAAAKNDPLRSIAYAACLLIPWMLIASRSLADTLGIAIGVCFLLQSARTKNWVWLSDPVIAVSLIAWAWMLLIVSPFAVDVSESYKVALPWVRWILLFAAMKHWLLSSRESLRGVAQSIVILAVLVVVDTLWQYHSGMSITRHMVAENYRLTGPFSTPKVGIFLDKLGFPVLGILLYLAMETSRRGYALAALAFAAAVFATIVLSGERTATVSFLIGIFAVCGIMSVADAKLRLVSISILGGIIALLLVLLATQPAMQDRLLFLSEQLGNFKDSAYGRLFIIGYDMGADHWLTGAGFKGFRALCESYLHGQPIDHCNLHPHNPYIEWFAEAGLAGLVLFIAMIAAMMRAPLLLILKMTGKERLLAACALATLVVHFLPFLGTQSFFSNWPALLLWYSVSVALSSLNLVKRA